MAPRVPDSQLSSGTCPKLGRCALLSSLVCLPLAHFLLFRHTPLPPVRARVNVLQVQFADASETYRTVCAVNTTKAVSGSVVGGPDARLVQLSFMEPPKAMPCVWMPGQTRAEGGCDGECPQRWPALTTLLRPC